MRNEAFLLLGVKEILILQMVNMSKLLWGYMGSDKIWQY